MIVESIENQQLWISGILSEGRSLIPMSSKRTSSYPLPVVWEDVSVTDWILIIWWLMSCPVCYAVTGFCNAIFFVVLTLWAATYRFIQCIETSSHFKIEKGSEAKDRPSKNSEGRGVLTWNEIYDAYKAIRLLSLMISKTCGSIALMYTGEGIFMSTVTLQDVFSGSDGQSGFDTVLGMSWIMLRITILCISAYICSQVCKIPLAYDNGHYILHHTNNMKLKDRLHLCKLFLRWALCATGCSRKKIDPIFLTMSLK